MTPIEQAENKSKNGNFNFDLEERTAIEDLLIDMYTVKVTGLDNEDLAAKAFEDGAFLA